MFLESLERRQLLSVQLIEPFIGSTYLRIDGTDNPDAVTLAQIGTSLTVIDNGAVSNWSTNSFSFIRLTLNAGGDSLQSNGPVTVPMLVYAGDGDDTLRTGDANDTVYGGWGDDRVYTHGGNDTAYGRDVGAWNPFLVPPDTDHDLISTHAGNDSAFGSEGNDSLFGYEGTDLLSGESGLDYVYGGTEGDVLSGGNDADRVFGEAGDDWLFGNGGNDSMYGNDGHDSLWGHDGNDLLHGQAGNDTVRGDTGADSVLGHDGDDSLEGGDQNDSIYGGANNDTIRGGSGIDSLHGESGNDDMFGDAGDDVMTGYYGNDSLNGGADGDLLMGEHGDDYLFGYTGDDFAFGGPNNDTLLGFDGDDYLSGDDGDDSLGADYGEDTLFGSSGNDSLNGGGNDDHIDGGGDDDELRGESGDDTLFGALGHDDLYGGTGADALDGGDGRDGLYGGLDSDTMTGGGGADRFLEHTWIHSFYPPGSPVPVYSRVWGAAITDAAAADARLGFEDAEQQDFTFAGQTGTYTYAAGAWAEDEVELIDSALAVMHHATGNDNLLERSDGSSVYLRRFGELVEATGSFNAGAVNAGTYLGYFPGAFSSDGFTRTATFHEFGHFRDSEYDAGRWRDLSGWVSSRTSPGPEWTQGGDDGGQWWYLSDALFVDGYARTNPNEDFATSFASLFMDLGGWDSTPDLDAIPAKKAFLEQMISDLSD